MRMALLLPACLGLSACGLAGAELPALLGMAQSSQGPARYPDGRLVPASEIAREERYCAPIDITFHKPGCEYANMGKVWSQNQQQGYVAGMQGVNEGLHSVAAHPGIVSGTPYDPNDP